MTKTEFWQILKESGFCNDCDYEYVINCLSVFCDYEAQLYNSNKSNTLSELFQRQSQSLYEALVKRGYYKNKEV